MKYSTKKLWGNLLIWVGLIIIILTHLPIVVSELPTSVSRMHGFINIAASIGMLTGAMWRRK